MNVTNLLRVVESNHSKSEYESLPQPLWQLAIENGGAGLRSNQYHGIFSPLYRPSILPTKNGGVSGVRFRNLLRDREMHWPIVLLPQKIKRWTWFAHAWISLEGRGLTSRLPAHLNRFFNYTKLTIWNWSQESDSNWRVLYSRILITNQA